MSTAKISVEEHDAGTVMSIRGEIDLSNSDALRSEILPAVPDEGPGMVLDLTEATYLDSSGIRLLFDIAEGLHVRGQRLVLVVSEAALVRRVVVLTKLEDAVPLVETVDDGLAVLDKD
jgi:anti-sigma B factor antagonist/stage II sporulation protein AA (anti-sigma F factor antagonist)